MKIAIVGYGNVGGTLAKVWAGKGHNVVLAARSLDDEKAKALQKQNASIEVLPADEAIDQAEVILVAVPAAVTLDLAKQWSDLTGKVIIDVTNAIRGLDGPYETGYHAFEALTGADVVKAFNTTGFENMANPVYGDTTADMFVAGSSEKAKEVARELAHDAGFEMVYDFGGVDKVKALEHFAFAWINLAIMQGEGRSMAFKVLKR